MKTEVDLDEFFERLAKLRGSYDTLGVALLMLDQEFPPDTMRKICKYVGVPIEIDMSLMAIRAVFRALKEKVDAE